MIDQYFPLPDVVKVLPRSVLFRDHRGRYHWQITIPQPTLGKVLRQEEELHAVGLLKTLTRYNSGAVIPTEKAFAFVTKRMAREYFLGKVGDKYHAILRAARAGKVLNYKAPFDWRPKNFVRGVEGRRYANTYLVVGDRIKFFPPIQDADPFFADYKHADRIEV